MVTKEENLKYFVEMMALHGIDPTDDDYDNPHSYDYNNDDGNSLSDAIRGVCHAHRVINGECESYEKIHLKLGNMAYEMNLTADDVDEYVNYLRDDIETTLANEIHDCMINSVEYKNVVDKTDGRFPPKLDYGDDQEWNYSFDINVGRKRYRISLSNSCFGQTNNWNSSYHYGKKTIHYRIFSYPGVVAKQYISSYIKTTSYPKWVNDLIAKNASGKFMEKVHMAFRNISLTLAVNKILTKGLPKPVVKRTKVK